MSKRKKPGRSKRPRSSGRVRPRVSPVLPETLPSEREFAEAGDERGEHSETSPRLTGGDVDADWLTAHSPLSPSTGCDCKSTAKDEAADRADFECVEIPGETATGGSAATGGTEPPRSKTDD